MVIRIVVDLDEGEDFTVEDTDENIIRMPQLLITELTRLITDFSFKHQVAVSVYASEEQR